MKRPQSVQDDLEAKQRLIVAQREANGEMVRLTIRAQEMTEQAQAAQRQAEATTTQLRESRVKATRRVESRWISTTRCPH